MERKCPYCAELIKADACLCRHCQTAVEPMQVPVVVLREPAPAHEVIITETTTTSY